MKSTLNVNVGLFGHVDSGKTSIAKILSDLQSTACFDKHPESQERGITIDLGFSAYKTDASAALRDLGYSSAQFTVVDCPGHADFIRTIISGADIIDVMLLVIDINEGIQPQTSESVVVGCEILNRPMIVLLNKVDLWEKNRCNDMDFAMKKIRKRLNSTRWNSQEMIPISTKKDSPFFTQGFQTLSLHLLNMAEAVAKSRESCCNSKIDDQSTLVYIDHCFRIKGRGNILTGTVLQGALQQCQMVQIPSLKLQRKVKSMQSFHTERRNAFVGDRIGICLKDIPSERIERTYMCSINSTITCLSKRIIVRIQRVRFYPKCIQSGERFHITLGHKTLLADVKFFHSDSECFDRKTKYSFLRKLPVEANMLFKKSIDQQYTKAIEKSERFYFAVVDFSTPLFFPKCAIAIASKLDHSLDVKSCRIAFAGPVCHYFETADPNQDIQITITRSKSFLIDRWIDNHSCICKGLVYNNVHDVSTFIGCLATYAYLDGDKEISVSGKIAASFGKSGKVRIIFGDQIPSSCRSLHHKVSLELKKYKSI